jgi:biofilm PGA synthesis lipoprotein PgaB
MPAIVYRLCFALLCLCLAAGRALAADSFIVLSYHDVQDQIPKQTFGREVVSLASLKAQFDWLKQKGYRVVSLQDLLDAKAGRKKLPERAVLLSFDDGYASFYHKVFPLLKAYRYPAMVALVGSWMDVPPGGKVAYGEKETWAREDFLSWGQVRELARSGLVEVASHSYDLHHGARGNPQGSSQPAGVTRIYDPASGRYEDDAAYAQRIREDLRRSAAGLREQAGVKPRAVVWPYGEYNHPLIEAAAAEGMSATFALADGRNRLENLSAAKRLLVVQNPTLAEFATMVETVRADLPQRVAHVDLDYIYDPDPVQTERNLLKLLERMAVIRPTAVYLQAYADPDGDGNADALYFPNRHLPMRADLFNRAAWQLRSYRIKVYAWMPVLAYRVQAPDDWFVYEWRDGKPQLSSHIYKRLSPFHPEARRRVVEIYEDLAKQASFSGLLFHDDALLSDYEDVSPAGMADIAKAGLPTDFATLHGSAELRMRWAKHKTRALDDFTLLLADTVRRYRPDIKTARNLYALPLLKPFSEEWFAQSYPEALKDYDYIAVEAMPLMEEAANPDAWLTELVLKTALLPEGLRKTVFELQSMDWRNKADIPMDMFLGQARRVLELGGVHLGYYPDNLFHDQPKAADLHELFAIPEPP